MFGKKPRQPFDFASLEPHRVDMRDEDMLRACKAFAENGAAIVEEAIVQSCTSSLALA